MSGVRAKDDPWRRSSTLAELIDWLAEVKRCTLVKFLGDYPNQQIANCHESVIHFDAIAETCCARARA